VKISAFYDDPDRGASNEINFGGDWQYHGCGPWKVVWLEATGELVVFNDLAQEMGVSVGGDPGNPIGDLIVGPVLEYAAEAAAHGLHRIVRRIQHHARSDDGRGVPAELSEEVSLLTIEPDITRLRSLIGGWEEHRSDPDGLIWLADRLGSPL
jgi:hypothetical protein